MVDPELVRRLVLDDQRTTPASDRALDVLAQRRVQRDAPRAVGKQTGLHRVGQNIAGVAGATVASTWSAALMSDELSVGITLCAMGCFA
jgi:hypothetical protein